MISTSSHKHLVKAMVARLAISNTAAKRMIDTAWFCMPDTNLRGCIVSVCNDDPDFPRIHINVPAADGYYDDVASFRIEKSDLANWKLLSLEEAYAFPENYKARTDGFEWVDGKVTAVSPRDDHSITVTVMLDDKAREMVMLAEMNDADQLLRYARENLNRDSRLCIEEIPQLERSQRSGGLPILDMIHSFEIA